MGKKNQIDPTVAKWDSVTADAHRLVYGDRGALYDHPAIDYTRTVELFNVCVGSSLTAADGVLFMLCVKLSRLAGGLEADFPAEMLRDSVVDLAGYAECLYGVLTYQPPEEDEETEDEEEEDE